MSESEGLDRTGKVRFGGVTKTVQLACVPEARVGDFVIVHAGIALNVLDPEEAQKVFDELAALEESESAT